MYTIRANVPHEAGTNSSPLPERGGGIAAIAPIPLQRRARTEVNSRRTPFPRGGAYRGREPAALLLIFTIVVTMAPLDRRDASRGVDANVHGTRRAASPHLAKPHELIRRMPRYLQQSGDAWMAKSPSSLAEAGRSGAPWRLCSLMKGRMSRSSIRRPMNRTLERRPTRWPARDARHFSFPATSPIPTSVTKPCGAR